MGVKKGECMLHLSEHYGDGMPGSSVRIPVDDVKAYMAELRAKEFENSRPGEPQLQEWGSWEITDRRPREQPPHLLHRGQGLMRRTETPEGRSVRLLRVGEQARHVLSELLQRGDVHNDVLQTHLVSITEVRMSADLRHATVFVKPLLGQDEEAVLKALRQNTAFLQREVARQFA